MSEKKEKKSHFIIQAFSAIYSDGPYKDFNESLKIAGKISSKKYFYDQASLNKFLLFLGRFPMYMAFILLGLAIYRPKGKVVSEHLISYVKKNFGMLKRYGVNYKPSSLDLSPEYLQYLEYSLMIFLSGMIISAIFMIALKTINPLLKKNKIFKDRHFKKDYKYDQHYVITPGGVLFTLGDRTAKEVMEDKRFWEKINMTPSGFKEYDQNTDLVIYEQGFKLAESYIY